MKNLTVLVLLCLCFTTAQAQRNRGGQEGGLVSLGASMVKFSQTGRRSGLIGGIFGYAQPIGSKNSFGLNAYYNTQTDNNDIKTNLVTLQPEFRNYFSDEAFRGVYLALSGLYQNQRTVFVNANTTLNNFGVGIGGGYNLPFNDQLSAALNVGYNYLLNSKNQIQTSNQSNSQWLVGLTLGIRL